MTTRRAFLVPFSFALLAALAACGGGGGGEDPCTAPGSLHALAVEGEPAPETLAGDFQAFTVDTIMDVAAGGWAVFVAGTTDPTRNRCLYIALPDGSLVLAWASGDVVPDAGGGLVSDVLGAWVNANGRVLALVTITGDGGGRTLGLLSARVEAGVVTERHDVIYDTTDMAPTGVAGLLDGISADGTYLAENDGLFFTGTTDAGNEGLWHAQPDGSGLTRLVSTASALPGGFSVEALRGTGFHGNGLRYAFIAERDDMGSSRALFAAEVGSPLYSLIAEEGDALPGGDDLEDLPDGQPLLLYASGSVVFKAVSDLADDYLLLGAPMLPALALAVEDFPAPGTGGDYGGLDLLINESGAATPLFRAELVGAAAGATFGIFAVVDVMGGAVLAFFDGRAAPEEAGAGVTFSSILPGLGARTDATADGSLVFANVLSNGRTGAFWLIPLCGLFTLALDGLGAPGGDVFSSLGPWRTDTAAGNALFVAGLQTAGSGVFRRGP